MGQRFSMDRYKTRWAYTFLAFPILFYIVVRYYPTFNAFYISMTDWNIVSKEKHFIGLANFKLLFSDEVFYQTMGNTIRYTVYGLPIGLLLSFTLAYLIDRAGALESFFKAAYFVPYITSLVALSWVWRWLYQQAPIGVFNNILISLGLPQQGFLYDKDQALWAAAAGLFVRQGPGAVCGTRADDLGVCGVSDGYFPGGPQSDTRAVLRSSQY